MLRLSVALSQDDVSDALVLPASSVDGAKASRLPVLPTRSFVYDENVIISIRSFHYGLRNLASLTTVTKDRYVTHDTSLAPPRKASPSIMTTVFSALPMPKGGRYFRKPAFLRSSSSSNPLQGIDLLLDTEELPTREAEQQDPDLRDLNVALSTLVRVFPDVQPEVFREMLLSMSEESRVEVIAEHLLKDKAKWVRGRYKTIAKGDVQVTSSNGCKNRGQGLQVQGANPTILSIEDTFRTHSYRQAVKTALYQEFKGLSHAAIKAVLAEHNHSYIRARPVLQQLSSKSWRFYLTSLWTKRRSPADQSNDHPFIVWLPDTAGTCRSLPTLRPTTSVELNTELYDTLVAPVLANHREELHRQDRELALQINDQEAEEVGAIYDCECCYMPTSFEQLATCDDGCHHLCFRCIRHAVHEALFGQGWARTVNHERCSILCLAPTLPECQGSIPTTLVQTAITTTVDGHETWQRFEDRVASECLLKSHLPLLSCPFCTYAEVDEMSEVHLKDPFAFGNGLQAVPLAPTPNVLGHFLAVLVYPFAYLLWPLLCLVFLLVPTQLSSHLTASHIRVVRRRRGLRFTCRSPKCSTESCSICFARWVDPHVCNETSLMSLRHAIEAATTSSIKRTCPKCQLSFVKSSGCNKLVCNCGYAMCYVCRNEIGKEGYTHFCQHFREKGGRCHECDRCDLYVVEDDEAVIRRAAEAAEKDWRDKEGKQASDKRPGPGRNGISMDRFGAVAEEVIAGTKASPGWDFDGVVDAILDALLV